MSTRAEDLDCADCLFHIARDSKCFMLKTGRFRYHIMPTGHKIQSYRLGLTALAWMLNSSPSDAAELQAIQAAEVDLQKCYRVSLGMSKSEAEPILGQPLSSDANFLTFGLSQCLVMLSPKDRVAFIYSGFDIVSQLSLKEVGLLVLKEVPFSSAEFGDLINDKIGEDELIFTSGSQNLKKLDVIVLKEGTRYTVSINRINRSIMQDDSPGFVLQ